MSELNEQAVTSAIIDAVYDPDEDADKVDAVMAVVRPLLATRESWASLDQLKPGDSIVWTSGGKTEVRAVFRVRERGDEWIVYWRDGLGADALNASVLVRRADTPPQQEAG